MTLCNFKYFVHLTGNPGVMNRNNNLRFIGNCRLNQLFVNILCIRSNINKNNFCTSQHKGIGS